jgi:hypothetical protein
MLYQIDTLNPNLKAYTLYQLYSKKSKAVPLHTMKELGGGEKI